MHLVFHCRKSARAYPLIRGLTCYDRQVRVKVKIIRSLPSRSVLLKITAIIFRNRRGHDAKGESERDEKVEIRFISIARSTSKRNRRFVPSARRLVATGIGMRRYEQEKKDHIKIRRDADR